MDSTATRETLPLSDITVVELGNLIAIPFTGVLLGDLGADIVKVERPDSGDTIRQSGDVGRAIFATLNRNKRSVALDLQTEAGRETYRDIVAQADVVIENLRPGVVEKLGVGYEDLTADRDDLIYLSLAGFLQGGPYEDRPGMDVVGQAMSGMMRMTGSPGEKPKRAGTSVVDLGTGMYGVIGVLLALWMRERTDRGERIDVGLFESASHLTNYWTVFAQLFGDHPPLGSSHPAFGLYDVFETDSDEWLFVGVITERHWSAFCDAIDADELFEDDRFETNEKRMENEELLYNRVQEKLRGRDRARVVEALLEASVPTAPLNEPSDIVDDPHLDAVGLLAETASEGESVQSVLTPLQGSDIDVDHYRDAPDVGEDTKEVLETFDLDADYSELEARGAFGDGPDRE